MNLPQLDLEQWRRKVPRPWGESVARVQQTVTGRLGGPARLRVVVLLALVLGLDGADFSTVGAVAPQLEGALHISNTEIGLLLTTSQLAAAAGTLPVGVLADRSRRERVIWLSVLLWAAAMVAGGLATSYTMLLISRIALGAVTATGGPPVASLVGDFFPAAERSRIYGLVLSGDLVGGGVGVFMSGLLAAISWRLSFLFLAAVSLGVAWAVWRFLPEPARGGQSRLRWGATRLRPVEAVPPAERAVPDAETAGGGRTKEVAKGAMRAGAKPVRRNVLHEDPVRMSWPRAVRHVLSVRTNVVLIVASALAYYFLAGVRTFAVVFFRGRYGLSQSTGTLLFAAVGAGAVIGIVLGGRVADRLIRRGRATARIDVALLSYLLAALIFLPALLDGALGIAMPFYFLAAIALAAGNAPTDAARLDIIHFRLWGRAESVRTFLRAVLQALAPLVFGFISDVLGGGHVSYIGKSGVAPHHARGLQLTFLLMLISLAGAGLILLIARRTYPDDVATAAESERRTAERAQHTRAVRMR